MYLLSLLTSLALVGALAQPALADTEAGAASTAVTKILGDWNGALFTTGCPTYNTGNDGQCWWWAANAWTALTTYAEENPGLAVDTTIESDLWSSYNLICGNYTAYSWGQCPTSADQSGKDPFTINAAGNTYFDDIGWWTQAWLNAYKLVGRPYYLYLAEELWNYVTNDGYKNAACGGIVQYHKGSGALGDPDAFANALYLRNSAWLYSITGQAKYMTGSSGTGGAINAASWIRGNLIYKYDGPALGTPGSHFMIADHVDSSCSAAGSQSWLQSQGEMANAWTDMGVACSQYGTCGASPSYYYSLADELGVTVTLDVHTWNPNYQQWIWPFEGYPGQAEPTVDQNGILSEPCEPPGVTLGSPSDPWPSGCSLGSSQSDFQPYLISKGIFERAIYCSNHYLADSTLTTFARANASYMAANLHNFGFLWDDSGTNAPVNFATRASVLDGLDAALGGSYAMC